MRIGLVYHYYCCGNPIGVSSQACTVAWPNYSDFVNSVTLGADNAEGVISQLSE